MSILNSDVIPHIAADTGGGAAWYGDRGLFGGGTTSVNYIEYINISSASNITDFGDLSLGRQAAAGTSNGSRGVFAGGQYNTGAQWPSTDTIDYVTISTTGNATDFGDLVSARYYLGACSNGTRGLFAGYGGNSIEYITIDTTGNGTDFGDLTQSRNFLAACGDATRGVWGGGDTYANVIDYVTVATLGNASDFGDLTMSRNRLAACSDTTRGVFGGGYLSFTNRIDYITIASTGNATDFGDLIQPNRVLTATASSTRGVFAGGFTTTQQTNRIEYITIQTTGNSTDFGDLSSVRHSIGSCAGD